MSVYGSVMRAAYALLDRNVVPDVLTRAAIRRLVGQRRSEVRSNGVSAQEELEQAFVEQLRRYPTIAIETAAANEQHYEVPPPYFLHCLGPRLKYSACYFPEGASLAQAEQLTLQMYCERAALQDGMHILDMGCGWGSLCLFLAHKYPGSTVYAVSNSEAQRSFIQERARERGLQNLTVFACNINDFEEQIPEHSLDRVMSVEMLEHMKNYEMLFGRISRWLKPGAAGKFFTHIFTYHHHSYHFDANSADPGDWMARHFFTGGTMPSADLLLRFQKDLLLQKRWKLNGLHYSRTLEAWLAKMDQNAVEVRKIFSDTYGKQDADKWVARWRTFYLACSELFAYEGGDTWYVSMYLFDNRE